MNKLISRIAVLGASIGMAVAVGVAVSHRSSEVARAAEGSVTINNASSNTDGTVTVTIAQASGSSAPITGDYGVRLYANNTVTITCDANITSLTIPWTKNSKKDFATVTANVGTYSHPSAAGNGTWTGSEKSIVLTVGSSGQIQFNAVNYEIDGSSKTITAVTGVESHPDTVVKNGTISPESVMLNVTYDDETPGVEKATNVVCDTSTLGEATATATISGATGSGEFIVEVIEAPAGGTVSISDPVTNTDGVVTVTFDKSTGQNAPIAAGDAGVRCYAKNTITITCDTPIANMTIPWTKNGSKPFATVTANVGEYTHPSAAGDGTWSGSANEIVLTLGDSGQIQLNQIEYDFGGSSKTITALELTNTSAKTSYYDGEAASTSGLKVVANYDDASTKDVTSTATITPNPATLTLGTTSVSYEATVSGFEGKSNTLVVNVTVSEAPNPIQLLYSASKDDPVDVYGYYVGFLEGTGPVIMDGEYGVVVYKKDADVSGYTEGETILHVTGTVSIYKGLVEIGSPTISVASGSYNPPSASVKYTVVGGETEEYASRLTSISGTVSNMACRGEGAPAIADYTFDKSYDVEFKVTVGSNAVTLFYKKSAQNPTDGAKLLAAQNSGESVTLNGFTSWFDGFQVQMTSIVEEKEDYTAEQFASELLSATNAKCESYSPSSSFEEFKSFFQNVWNQLSAKYDTLPSEQKTILMNTQASETGTDVQKAMARYDFLTGKYGLSEFISGRVIDYSIYAGTPEIAHGGIAGYVIVISIGTASALAIGLVLMLKKKKHTK